MDSTYHREGDTSKEAIRRGRELFSQIYERIPGYDLSKTLEASPDYYHIVTGTRKSSQVLYSTTAPDSDTQANTSCSQSSFMATFSRSMVFWMGSKQVISSWLLYWGLIAMSRLTTIC